MSRTPHFTPRSRRAARPEGHWAHPTLELLHWWTDQRHNPIQRTWTLHSLRYTHAETTAAAREGRRPVPVPVTASITVWQYCRANPRYRAVGRWTLHAERQARARARTGLGAALRYAREADWDAVDDATPPPLRHRQVHADFWDVD